MAMAALPQPSIEDFYLKQKRKQPADKSLREKIRQDEVTAVSQQSYQDTCTFSDILFLKAFDLDYKYGPAAGMSRAERWKRAEKLGLNPDPRIMQLIQQNPDNNIYSECLWKGTLVGE